MPRVYISSPLDALRTFNLAYICLCREVFQSVLACTRSKEEDFFLPALAQSRGGLSLACTRSKSRRTFSCLHSLKVEEDFFLPQLAQGVHLLPPGCTEDFFSFSPSLAHRRGGLLLFLACTRSRVRRSFSLSRLHSLEGEEVSFSFWCLRSSKNDEDFKTLTTAADRRKTMGTLKLLTGAANRRKMMGSFKTFN